MRRSLIRSNSKARTFSDWIPSEELRDRKPFAPGFLQFGQAQAAFATSDDDAVSIDRNDLPGSAADSHLIGAPDLDCKTVKIGKCTGKRIEGSDFPV